MLLTIVSVARSLARSDLISRLQFYMFTCYYVLFVTMKKKLKAVTKFLVRHGVASK